MKTDIRVKTGYRDALIKVYRQICETLELEENGKQGEKLLQRKRNIVETRVASINHLIGILDKEAALESQGDKEEKTFYAYTTLGKAKKMLDKFLSKYNPNWGKFRAFLICHDADGELSFYNTQSREDSAYNLGIDGYTPEKMSVKLPEENFARLKNAANAIAKKTFGDNCAVCISFKIYNSESSKDIGVFGLDKVSSITLNMVEPSIQEKVQKRLKGRNGI